MIISNLNYLENSSEEIFGGSLVNIHNTFTTTKKVTANVKQTFVNTVTNSLGDVTRNVAEVVVKADATGKDTFISVIFGAQTEGNRSQSFADVLSIVK
ncbi:MAG: hypothetical protein KA716_10880 [Gloeotrichia echinulata DEX184]|jgi:hypothetical protein|nr:hypothetical protein [Gloeotrichia echinulata DEX184]